MAFIKTIPAKTASGEVLDMYRHQEAHWGYVPNYSKVFSHRPEALSRWGRLLAEIRRPMDDRRFELVTFVVARELRHSSCSLAHGRMLADILGDDAVVAIAQGKTTDVVTEAERAMMQYARDIARGADKITSGQVEALKTVHGFSDAEVFDIAAVAAGRCFLTKILDALGCEPDVGFMSMNDELRHVLSVGRPISHKAPEYCAA